MLTHFLPLRVRLCPSDLLETGPREGVVAAGAGVVEEDGAWAEETASTPVGNEISTNTAAMTKRESVLNCDLSRPVNLYCNNKHDCCPRCPVVVALNN